MTYGADNLAYSRRTPIWSAVDRYVPAAPATIAPAAGPGEPASAKTVEEDTQQAIDAKASLGSQKAPAMGLAASAVKSAKDADAVSLTADALKLTSETIAKATPAANSLNAGGNIIDGLNKAAQGDAFGAASAASAAAEKIAPALAKSGVGAIASAVILGTGDNKLGEQAKALGNSALKVIAPSSTKTQRAKAAFDFTINLQNLAGLARTLTNAAINVGRYGVNLAARAASLAPAAKGVKSAAGVFAATTLGRTLGFLNKWIPLLNVAGVAISAKTAVDVFRAEKSSATSKVLSIASLGTAGLALWAGFALPGVAFLGIVAGSIGLDLVLAGARKRDAAEGDMDAKSAHWATHPHKAAADLAGWIGQTVPMIASKARELVSKARERLFGGAPRPAPDPRRSLARA